jgi:CheY-like chemotaxis protein
MKRKSPKYKFENTLLIDDNDLDNFINQKMMESTHFSKHIHTSINGEVALDFINDLITSEAKPYPDIMFVDLNMPIMDGFEFIENFKKIKNEKLMESKIVILTSSIDNEDRVKAEKIDNRITFINKPLTNEFLNSF